MRSVLGSILFVFLAAAASAQYGDCDKALEMKAGEGVFIGLSGAGERSEISDTSTVSLYWFKKEHHVCWLKLPVTDPGELIIEIESFDAYELDFLLFKYSGPDFCNDVREKKIKPVRSNLAPWARRSIPEKTGLSAGATKEFVPDNESNTYSKFIEVKKGEIYYLVIDSKHAGRATVLYRVSDGKSEFGKSPMNLEKKDLVSPSVPLHIRVIDEETGQPVTARLSIEDLVPLETVKQEASEFKAELSSSQSIRIDANASGYMFYSQSVMAPALDPGDPSTYQPVNVEIRLKKLKEGDKVALRSIRFQPDKAEFMQGSYPALQSLTNFLLSNPTVRIEIGGHINGPDGSSAAGKAMSKKRAKAVYDYLLKRGIDKKRLRYKGYGNSQMIWPDPQNERQAEENRRVEIKIISK